MSSVTTRREQGRPHGGPLASLRTVSGLRRAHRSFLYALLTVGAVVMITPFLYMLSTSLKIPAEIYVFPPRLIPTYVAFENYREALTVLPFDRYFLNTVVLCATTIVGAVLTSSLVGYGFARLEARGRDAVFVLVLATMMLPGQVTLIPHYVIFKTLGWIDTLLPLIVPFFFGGGAFNVFLMRQFLINLPRELDDAAKIDGASYLRIWWSMILPLAKPPMAVIGIFTFIAEWNNFFGPLIYLHSPENRTMALALQFFQGEYGAQIHWLMAASVAMLVPVLIVFFAAQRVFIRGIALTGIVG